jgi:AraC-like DNA-binding protein
VVQLDPNLQLEDAFLKKVNDIIEKHLSESDFEMPLLCKLLSMSQSQWYCKLKAQTDKSIASYILIIRLHKGMDLLTTTGLTISEIAHEVGFTNPAYFSRAFSKEFGDSPTKFRNELISR